MYIVGVWLALALERMTLCVCVLSCGNFAFFYNVCEVVLNGAYSRFFYVEPYVRLTRSLSLSRHILSSRLERGLVDSYIRISSEYSVVPSPITFISRCYNSRVHVEYITSGVVFLFTFQNNIS